MKPTSDIKQNLTPIIPMASTIKSLLWIGILGFCAWTSLMAADKKTEKASGEELEYLHWGKTSFSGVLIDGSEAEFMRRHHRDRVFSGGIENFHFVDHLSKDVELKLDARGLFDAHDYKFKLEVEKAKFGKWEVGYKEFRTWYNGDGGFFPVNGQWFRIYDNELALDRGEAWFKAELALPDLPVLEFEYMYEFRVGQKDSLHWGDTAMTDGYGTRKIVPTLRDINERKDIFDFNLSHTIEDTSLKAGLRYEVTDDLIKLYVRRNPYERTDRSITTREIAKGDSFDFHGSTETWFSEKLLLATGYSLRTLDTDIGGSFIYGSGYDADFDARFPQRQTNDSGYLDLEGGSQKKQVIVNFNSMYIPKENWNLLGGIRIDSEDSDGFAHHLISSSSGQTTRTYVDGSSDTDFLRVSENLEARYSGMTNWVFFVKGDFSQNHGDMTETLLNPAAGTYTFLRETGLDRVSQKYTGGVNWYPAKRLNLGAQYYHKINTESYIHRNDSTQTGSGDRYPAFIKEQEFETDDFNMRAKWRILNNLTSMSRYDFQETSISSTMDGLIEQRSGRITSHIFGETLTWSPMNRLYLQANLNYALNRTETPVTGYLGSVQEAKNNYYNTGLAAGYALDNITDLNAQYSYYRADNYYDNSIAGLPLGSGAEEHQFSLKVDRRISEQIHWAAQYGFFSNRDQLYGGNHDYNTHLLYTSLQINF